MRLRIAVTMCLSLGVVALGIGRHQAIGSPKAPADAPQSALEAFKKLSGDWVGKGTAGPGGDAPRVNFRVTAGGSAVVETELPGTDQEMITVIHPDGDDLVLTHYCHLGNQPQMRAPGKMDGNRVAFKFVRVSNASAEKDPHMHAVTYTFNDDGTLTADWTFYQNNKPAGNVAFELKRKK